MMFEEFLYQIIKEVISPQALLYIVILGMLIWIKFNCLPSIIKELQCIKHATLQWQKKHEKRSEEIWKNLTRHGEDIAGLKKGKVDK